jgi:hypothetical protein
MLVDDNYDNDWFERNDLAIPAELHMRNQPKNQKIGLASNAREQVKRIGGDSIVTGEIVTHEHYERGLGQIRNHSERIRLNDPNMINVPQQEGNRAVVTYDPNGHVNMVIFAPRTDRPVGRAYLGRINPNARNKEDEVRALVNRATTGGFIGGSHGPDLYRRVRTRTAAQQQSVNHRRSRTSPLRTQAIVKRNNRINRFEETDAFFDKLINDYLLG